MNHSPVSYTITPLNPEQHLFAVQLSFASQANKSYQLRLPAWLPGSYMIRDFAKNIIELTACNNQTQALAIQKLDKQSWQVTATDERITLNYQVHAFDQSVRTAYLDNIRGFFNGSSTFLEVVELAEHPCQLTLVAPNKPSNWKVATGLKRCENTKRFAFGDYCADNYAQLIDCPVELSDFSHISFTVANVEHHLVFSGQHYGDLERVARDVKKLCQHHIALFGEVPFSEYWFLTNLVADGFGGLEHKNSTALIASRYDLPNIKQPEQLSDGYKTFLSLCSHEYFHAWNVCRIKPKEFIPYDLSQEVYTEQLWAYEGITSYYDDFSLYRTGLISFDEYLNLLGKTITRVHRGAGQTKQSVADSSYYTWTKFYQQGADGVNNIVSYYTKGSMIALWLDLTIRQHTQSKVSLDQLMRILWQQHGKTATGTLFTDYLTYVAELTTPETAQQLEQLIRSEQVLDLTTILASVGVQLTYCHYKQVNSLDAAEQNAQAASTPYLGVMYKNSSHGLIITQVQQGSPAALAGIAVNDVLLALDQLKVSEPLAKQLGFLPVNKAITAHVFRDDQLLCLSLQLTTSPQQVAKLVVQASSQAQTWQNIIV